MYHVHKKTNKMKYCNMIIIHIATCI